jgi:cysteine protease ATG4
MFSPDFHPSLVHLGMFYNIMKSAAVIGRLYDQSVNYLFANSGPVRVGGNPIYMIGGIEYAVASTGDSSEAARLSNEFRAEIDKMPWMTYRKGFELIPSRSAKAESDSKVTTSDKNVESLKFQDDDIFDPIGSLDSLDSSDKAESDSKVTASDKKVDSLEFADNDSDSIEGWSVYSSDTAESGPKATRIPSEFGDTLVTGSPGANAGGAGASGWMLRVRGSAVNGFTSDSGWGCTLRTTQMMTANALMRDAKRMNRFNAEKESSLLSLFSDSFSSPLSIHNMIDQSKIDPGEWFKPSQAGWAMAALAKPYINTHVAMDGGLSRREVKKLLNKSGDKGLLVYVPVLLGNDWIDVTKHKKPILDLFENVPQFIGIVGGDITHSYYFVAASEDYLYIMDPHTTQASLPHVTEENMKQVIPSQPGIMAMRWSRLSSTMMYGFLLNSEQDLIDLAKAIEKIGSKIGFNVNK